MTQHLFLYEPNVVFQARVNQTTFEHPIAEVAFDNGTALGTVKEGYTVFFGTSAGSDDLGRQRVRAGSTLGASGTLNFGRSSLGVMDGTVKLENDAYITIFEDRRPWTKLPRIADDGTIYKDEDEAYSDQNEEPPPKANAGIGHAASLAGLSTITVDFDSAGSFATADGATITDYLWDVGDGMITVGTSTSSTITATFPAGFRLVSLTVTDSNGKTGTTYVPVYCRDPDDDTTIQHFEILNKPRRIEGQELEVRIFDDIPASTYPNGTLVMLWEDEPSSASDRSHMQFIGWHQSDPAQITAEKTGTLRDTTLRCVDVAGMMRRLPGFPVEIISAPDPDNWGQMSSPNMDKYLWFLLHAHTTIPELCDWTWSGTGSDYPFVILGSDGESLWDQLQRRSKALVPDYITTCNRYGQLQTIVDPMLQDSADRTATVQAALDEEDITDISWEGQNYPRIHWLRGEAIVAHASNIASIFCVAPGEAPSQGLSEQPSGEQLAKSQADLNSCEGHRYARLNAPYSLFTIILAGNDDRDVDPADLTWVTVTISAAYAAQRGLTFTAARGLVHEVNTRYESTPTGLLKTHELLWELETVGEPATTVEYDETDFPEPDYDPPPDPGYDPDPGPSGENDGFGTNYAWTDSTLGRTRDLSASSPSWSDITPVGVTNVLDFILDPWAPRTTGYLLADNSVYKSTDLDQASPSFSQILTTASIESGTGITLGYMRKIVGSINAQGFFMFIAVAGGGLGQVWAVYTDDGGSTWSYTNTGNIGAEGTAAAFDIVPHLVGGNIVAYVASNNRLAKTTNGGQSWSLLVTGGLGIGGSSICLHCPYDGNESGNIAIIAGDSNVLKYNDGTSTYFGAGGTGIKRHAVETYTQDAEKVVLWTTAGDIKTSDDGGSSFTTEGASGLSGTPTGAGGFPFDSNQYYVITNSGIFVSTDGGGTFTDKTGDWAFGFSNTPYKNGVVPLWVAE